MISIIIPTLNEEKILEKTLKSLRELNIIPYEIIVSDGRSKDKTIEIAKMYADKVMVYEGEKRQTIGMGRNLGASVARGEFLVFLDADMHIPDINNFFKKTLDIFEKNKKLVGLTVYLKVFPEMANLGDIIIPWLFNRMVYIYNNIIHYGASSGEFQMVRAEIFKKLKGFDERLVGAEDFDMFARLSKNGLTQSEPTLTVFHTGRRAHKIGWPKLLYSWFMNWLHANFLKRSWSSEWEEIR